MVWDVARKCVVEKHDTNGTILSALCWRPEAGANTLAGIGEDGQISLWRDIVPEDMRGPAASHEDNAPSLAQQSAEGGDVSADNAGDFICRYTALLRMCMEAGGLSLEL